MSCLLFYDFLITSHGSRWKLTATRLPAEFYIRECKEWIIKGSHLEIMKRSKMPMLIAQGAVGIIGRCYCYFLNIIVGQEMRFAEVTHTSRIPHGAQGHPNKRVISTCDMVSTFIVSHSWMNKQIQTHTNPEGRVNRTHIYTLLLSIFNLRG